MDIAKALKEEIARVVRDIYGIEVQDVSIEHPENPQWGDYASNIALKLAKELNQSPMEIAKEINYRIQVSDIVFERDSKSYRIFDAVEYVSPGFINFAVSQYWLQNVLYLINEQSSSYGISNIGFGKRIALEHSNVNPNKAAHIGHLRNACIGQFIERVYENLGYGVEVQYYANDLGVQVATSYLGIKHNKKLMKENYDKFDHFAWDVYSWISSEFETSDALKSELSDLLIEIEDSNSVGASEQANLADKILADQLSTFSQLDIDYDVVIHERDIVYLKFWDITFEELKKNENVYFADSGPSKGCWLVKLSDEKGKTGNPNVDIEEDKIIVRANGVPTYTGKDIAYHMWKYGLLDKDFFYKKYDIGTQKKTLYTTTSTDEIKNGEITFSNVDIVFDVIDVKQTYAMDTVKKSLKYLGYTEAADNMKHINYGFVYLSPSTAEFLGIDISDGKTRYGMSGRKGWGVKIDDFVNIIDNKLTMDYGEFDARDEVRNGAIKFEMLKFNTFQDLVFDLDSAVSIKGFSGPYLQYTHARCNSLLNRGGLGFDPNTFYLDMSKLRERGYLKEEEAVLRHIYKYSEVVFRSAQEFAPNMLCTFLFELAQKYNTLYNELPVLKASDPFDKHIRLLLTSSVKQVLSNGLSLLGIHAPEEM